jgi:hypothetical protein
MLRIIDLLKGKTVISDIDEDFVESQLLKYIEVEYEEELPEVFWLSQEALEALLSDSKDEDFPFKEEEEEEEEDDDYYSDEEDDDYDDDEEDMYEERYNDEPVSDELKSILWNLLDYLKNNSEFIDADGNNKEDVNERGCYLAFEHVEENSEYKVYGTVKKNDNLVPGFRLELYDDELISDDFLGFGFTDDTGTYQVEFGRSDFSKDPLDFKGIPDLYLDIAEFDKISAEFKTIKRFYIPPTDDKEVSFDIEL